MTSLHSSQPLPLSPSPPSPAHISLAYQPIPLTFWWLSLSSAFSSYLIYQLPDPRTPLLVTHPHALWVPYGASRSCD